MNPGQVTCKSCSAVFSVAADAASATCPGCGQVVQVKDARGPSKTLTLPGSPAPADPLDDLPGMVEGEEIDMGFFEGPASAPPPKAPAETPPAPAPSPAVPPPVPDDIPEAQAVPASPAADGVLGRIALRKVDAEGGDGSKPLPPLAPMGEDGIPEAAPLMMPDPMAKKPVVARERQPSAPSISNMSSKPPPPITAGPATPPIKMPDQGIEVMVPLAPVEEVSRGKETGSIPVTRPRPKPRDTTEVNPADRTRAPLKYDDRATATSAGGPSSKRFLIIGVVALIGAAAAVSLFLLFGN